MADFQQRGPITTLHRLTANAQAEAASSLSDPNVGDRVALLIPCLITEFDGTALPEMVNQIATLEWLDRVIVGIDGGTKSSFLNAERLFASLPQKTTVIWNDSLTMGAFDRRIGVAPKSGKGSNLWRCIGAVAAFGDIDTIVVHDADISTYESSFVARLAHPIVDERLGFDFVKGFYPRFDNHGLNGRVTRLLVGPLLESLASSTRANQDILYLQSFRYPLAGEFATRLPIATSLAIPEHWGVDISLLMAARASQCHIAQTDLTDNYDHKHQSLSLEHPESGLHRMARDIISTTLSLIGVAVVDAADFDRRANQTIAAHRANAISNSLPFDDAQEESAVALFSKLIREEPSPLPADLPAWDQLEKEFPDCLTELKSAVESQSTAPGSREISP
jgi:glucosyl-3-phosphoglycerate synthase